MKFLTAFLLLSSLMLGFIYYTLSSTSIPYKALAAVLSRSENITIDGIRGTLRSGLELDHVAFMSDSNGAKFEVKNFKSKYGSFKSNGNKKIIVIENISLDRFEVIMPEGSKASAKSEGRVSTSDRRPPKGTTQDSEEIEVRIKNISLKNLIFKRSPESEGVVIDLFVVKNMFLTSNGVEAEMVEFTSNYFDANGSSRIINNKKTDLSLGMVFKAQNIDAVLKNISLALTLNAENKEIKIQGTGFDEKFLIDLDTQLGRIIFKFSQLDLGEYLKDEYKVNQIDGDILIDLIGDEELPKVDLIRGLSLIYKEEIYSADNNSVNVDKEKIIITGTSGDKKIDLIFNYGKPGMTFEIIPRISL